MIKTKIVITNFPIKNRKLRLNFFNKIWIINNLLRLHALASFKFPIPTAWGLINYLIPFAVPFSMIISLTLARVLTFPPRAAIGSATARVSSLLPPTGKHPPVLKWSSNVIPSQIGASFGGVQLRRLKIFKFNI